MDWVHCNSCHVVASLEKNRSYSLTNCGHIYCNICIKSGTIKKCLVCGNNSYTTVQLNSDLKPEIQEYFKSPEELLKHALQVQTFQRGHQRNLNLYNKNLIKKYKAAKQEIYKLSKEIKNLQKENKELWHQHNMLKEKLLKEVKKPYSKGLNNKSFSKSQPLPPTPSMSSASSVQSRTSTSFSKAPKITPRRLTLDQNKLTTPSTGSSGRTQQTTSSSFGYRTPSLYSSQPATPSTPGSKTDTPDGCTKRTESPLSLLNTSMFNMFKIQQPVKK